MSNRNLNKLIQKVASIRAKFADTSNVDEEGNNYGFLEGLGEGAKRLIQGVAPESLYHPGLPKTTAQEGIMDSGFNPMRHFSPDGTFTYDTVYNPDAGGLETLGQNFIDYGLAYGAGAGVGNAANRLGSRLRASRLGVSPRATAFELSQKAPHAFAKYFGMSPEGAIFHRYLGGVTDLPSPETTMGIPRSLMPGVNLVQGAIPGKNKSTVGVGGTVVPFPGKEEHIRLTDRNALRTALTTGIDASTVPEAVRMAIMSGDTSSDAPGLLRRMYGAAFEGNSAARPKGAKPFFMENVDAKGEARGNPRAVFPNERVTSRKNTGRARTERTSGALATLLFGGARSFMNGNPVMSATQGTSGLTSPEYDRRGLELQRARRDANASTARPPSTYPPIDFNFQ
jgi:hypothetical protein